MVTEKNGILDFSNKTVYCFGDLEGYLPSTLAGKCFPTATNTNFGTILSSDAYVIPKDTAIVFTGDLVDRGIMSIRLLHMFTNIAELPANNQNYLFTCGNRDINKLRLTLECWMKPIENILLTTNVDPLWHFSNILNHVKTFEKNSKLFQYTAETLNTITDVKGIAPGNKNLFLDNHMRIANIYGQSMGAGKQVEFFAAEYTEIFQQLLSASNPELLKILQGILENSDERHVFIAAMNMLMGVQWPHNLGILDHFKGLYVRFLSKCKILGAFYYKTNTINTLCLVSHSGVAFKDHIGFVISGTIGTNNANAKNASQKTLNEKLEKINKDFENLVTSISKHPSQQNAIADMITNLKKYMCLSAASGETSNVRGATINSELSPIVTSSDNIKGPSYFESVAASQRTLAAALRVLPDTKEYTRIVNVFGHQPIGVLPEAAKIVEDIEDIKGIETYHVRLDVSKSESLDEANKVAFAMLKFSNVGLALVGKMFGKGIYVISNNDEEVYVHGSKLFKERQDASKPNDKNMYTTMNLIGPKEYTIGLDTYCQQSINKAYRNGEKVISRPLFTMDGGNTYFGQFGWNKVMINDKQKSISGGRKRQVPVKTDRKVVDKRTGVKRTVYEKGGRSYVKRLDRNIGKYKFVLIRDQM